MPVEMQEEDRSLGRRVQESEDENRGIDLMASDEDDEEEIMSQKMKKIITRYTDFKVNLFGFILQNTETGALQYHRSSVDINLVLEQPFLESRPDNLELLSQVINNIHFLEWIRQQRPNSKWIWILSPMSPGLSQRSRITLLVVENIYEATLLIIWKSQHWIETIKLANRIKLSVLLLLTDAQLRMPTRKTWREIPSTIINSTKTLAL